MCVFSELGKAIAFSRVDAYVQDLLLSICVNCRHGDQIDREIISNLIKIKPKPKHQQHFSDCFRELIKANPRNYESFIQLVVRNELFSQNQISQQAQNQQNKLNHNYFLLQITFSNDPTMASKIFAQTLLKIILQKNSDQFLRSIKVLLRDTVRNCRQDFDLTSFINEIESDNLIKEYYVDSGEFQKFNSTNSIFSFAGGLADFSQAQIKERYLNSPEQCYTIDSWPSEAEKSTFFRVVSEIPVLSETLHQVLIITQNLPEHLYMLMLCAEENLLKTAALVHKDVYSIKLVNMDSFMDILFQICMYKYQDPPNLVVTVLYWKCWQILLLISALDPIEFGIKGWHKYPTLRLLMEMVMTEDYNFPPHCSINGNMTYEKYKSMEATAIQLEKAEILEFENMFEAKQGTSNKTEANSKLIGQVMKFDPLRFKRRLKPFGQIRDISIFLYITDCQHHRNFSFCGLGPPRRPPAEAIMNIRKLNSEYKLGQLLCKSRNPDFLLMLINSQDSKTSLPWLASMIETSQECLEILPIHIVCELVWNLTSGTEEEIQPKRQWNVEILLNSKQQVRNGSLKILNCLLPSVNSTLDRGAATFLEIFQTNFDLNHLFNNFKQLVTYENFIQPLLLDYCSRIILVETNPDLFGSLGLDDLMNQVQVLNAENFAHVLKPKVTSKLLATHFQDCQHLESHLVESLITSYSDKVLIQLLSSSYGLGTLSVYHILKKIEIALHNKHSSTLNQITNLSDKEAHVIKDHIDKTTSIKEK
ncbi:Integrator complex subunit 1 [Brachionus plicatilis]|uniref:Integrator complex subunit 1 n=1 Tax=Brachionus plicatilis TaxID=10195 RepID=A0A3M7QSW3_BRAPC|nr:Integrator complex subunit 1 [Brachionus plicatilis]